MRKLILCLACMLGLSEYAFSQRALTLEEAVALGLDNNYAIRIAKNQQEMAENLYHPGEAGLLPFVDASAGKSWSVQDVEQQFRDQPAVEVQEEATSNSTNASLEAGYLLNLGSLYTFKRLGTLSELSELEAKVTIENTVAAITTAYYRVVLEQQRYSRLQETLELSDERLQISKDRYELGKASKQEYLAAQVDYNTDLSELINQEEVIAVARIQLNELLGSAAGEPLVIKDTILIEDDLVLDNLLEAANFKNPLLMAAQREINVAHLQMRELQAARLPQLSLFGAYGRDISESEAGFILINQRTGFNYGLTASVNLFNGFVLRNRIQNARIQQHNQKLEYEELLLALESDISATYAAYQNSLRLLEVAQSNYEVAIENADIALERYKMGITSSLEFREAQQNALVAELRLINAVYTIKAAEIELKRLAGSVMSAV
ncbi:TolC family protein [Nafulsella turpanensis]|uniref:TolC family protein n=1 Tax=Nafulsella turpanensis TaxID=1265690 RepID=UPI000475A437|nr:TolC family protein [Nafulsella turpanensis]